MANQPPIRPWFRLASQLRTEAAAPPPQPPQPPQPPRGPPIRQLVRQPSILQPPPPPVQPQPPTLQPPPPPPPPAAQPQPQPPPQPTPPPAAAQPQPLPQLAPPPPPPPPQPSVTPRGESTVSAPPSGVPPRQPASPLPTLRPIRTSRSPPPSPKVSSPSPKPSPFQPPPPTRVKSPSPRPVRDLRPTPEPELKTIPEAQPKTTSAQENIVRNGTTNSGKVEPYKSAHNGEPKLGISQVDTKGPPAKKKDEGDTRIVTLAGENVGAYMDLGPPYSLYSRKQQQQQQQSSGSLPKQSQVSNPATDNGKSSEKNEASAATAKAKPMTSLVNSNVQSINNSIMFNSTCTQSSPGVHMTLTSHRNPKNTPKATPPPQ